MPSLDINVLNKLVKDHNYSIFIETGTYNGETIFKMEPHFEKLYTVEISPQYHISTKSKYRGNKIKFILGDSSSVFSQLLPTIHTNTIFFLDGHWSAGDTGRGNKDCPLMEECQMIKNKFRHNAILIIDDFRLFGKGPKYNNEVCNWEDISKEGILGVLGDRITNVYHIESELHSQDRLVIHIKSI
jgi:hypothetical protein